METEIFHFENAIKRKCKTKKKKEYKNKEQKRKNQHSSDFLNGFFLSLCKIKILSEYFRQNFKAFFLRDSSYLCGMDEMIVYKRRSHE